MKRSTFIDLVEGVSRQDTAEANRQDTEWAGAKDKWEGRIIAYGKDQEAIERYRRATKQPNWQPDLNSQVYKYATEVKRNGKVVYLSKPYWSGLKDPESLRKSALHAVDMERHRAGDPHAGTSIKPGWWNQA